MHTGYLSIILGMCLALLAQGTWAATVYKTVDAEGRVSYSDQPPENGEAVEVLDVQVSDAQPTETELDRIEAMRETTDRMAADRREREAARAKTRAEAEAARAAAYRDQYPDYYSSGEVTQSYSYSRSGGYYYPPVVGRPRPPYYRPPFYRPPHGRPPHHRPPHVRPPLRPGIDRGDVAGPGFSYSNPAGNQIKRRYTGKAREVFYGR